MRPMSRHFVEIHGVDVSDEMIALAHEKLRDIPHAHPHVTDGSSLAQFRRRILRFRLFLRRVPAHPQPRRGVRISARSPARAEDRRPGACCSSTACSIARTPHRYLGRRALFLRRHSGVRVAQTISRCCAGGRRHAIHVDHLAQAAARLAWLRRKPAKIDAAGAHPPHHQCQQLGAGGAVPRALRVHFHLGRESAAPMPDCIICGSRWAVRSARCAISGRRIRSGLQQVNVMLPELEATGLLPVEIQWLGRTISPPATLRVIPPGPSVPRICSITDGVNLSRKPHRDGMYEDDAGRDHAAARDRGVDRRNAVISDSSISAPTRGRSASR